MYSHIVLGANDLSASKAFYDATLGALGGQPGALVDDFRLAYMNRGGVLVITKPNNGGAATGANGGTVGFSADSPEEVDAWHAAGVANGGTSCEDPPGYREGSYGKLYLAYLRDPAGNKLCGSFRPAS